MSESPSLSASLRRYADQVPVVLSVPNLKKALLDAAERIDYLEAKLARDDEEPHEHWIPKDGDRAFVCDADDCPLAPHMVKSEAGAYRRVDGRWVLPGA